MFDDRKYVIISAAEINSIDFSEVLETSSATCRYSVDGTKTFVKYHGEMPTSLSAIVDKSQEYNHDEILSILGGEDWTSLVEDI